MKNTKELEEISEQEEDKYFKNRSKIFLESAIWNMLDCYDVKEVIKILRENAQHLEDYP